MYYRLLYFCLQDVLQGKHEVYVNCPGYFLVTKRKKRQHIKDFVKKGR